MAVGLLDFNVKADIREVSRMLNSLERTVVPQAAAGALNKTARPVRAEAVRAVAKASSIKAKDVRLAIKVTDKATRYRLLARVEATGRTPNLIEFVTPARRQVGAFRKKSGVSARAWGKVRTYKGSFIIQDKKSEDPIVVSRKGRERTPIKRIYGPSIPRTFIRKQVITAMEKVAARRWPIVFQQELRYRLGRLRGEF